MASSECVKRAAGATRMVLRLFDYAVLCVMGAFVLYGLSWAISVGMGDRPEWILGALIVLAPQAAVFGTVFTVLVTNPPAHDAELLASVFVAIVAAITGSIQTYLFWVQAPAWTARMCFLVFTLAIPGGMDLYRRLNAHGARAGSA